MPYTEKQEAKSAKLGHKKNKIIIGEIKGNEIAR